MIYERLSWESISKWDFNIFELNLLTGGHALLFIGWAVLGSPHAQVAMAKKCGINEDRNVNDMPKGYAFIDDFKVPPKKLCNYMRVLENDYRSENPYHNEVHAADVLQTLHALIQMTAEDDLFRSCPKVNLFAILLSAAVHDVAHPGKTNAFQTNARTELAVMYNDASVLENWHIAYAFARMLDLSLSESSIQANLGASGKLNAKSKESDCNILCRVSADEFSTIRSLMIEAVLHTDMTKHFPMVNAAKGMLMSEEDDEREDISWKVLMFMLHMADISSQAKPAPLFTTWTDRCMAEFFAQGDEEAELGFPISPNCDRNETRTPDSQVGFIKFVVEPAYEVLGQFIPTVQEDVLPIIASNLDHWTLEKERANEASEEGNKACD
jgi:hypothetical protein